MKFTELLRRCGEGYDPNGGTASADHNTPAIIQSIGISAAKLCFFRWCMRAMHGSGLYLDPLIPSWTDEDLLTSFFQRQLITISMEDRKLVNSEELKEAGAALATLCLGLAKEVAQFRSTHPPSRPSNWSDYSEGMSAMESLHQSGATFVSVTWENRASVHMLSPTFENFKRSYRGDSSRFLSAVFGVQKRYDTIVSCVTALSFMDYSLPPSTLSVLSQTSSGIVEARSNPVLVFGENTFCGLFPDVDAPFGGLAAFGKEGGGGEVPLLQHGGFFVVLPPCENIVAGLYLHRIYDAMESCSNVCPLSFVVVLPAQCFRDTRGSPTVDDISQLEPRLVGSDYVRRAEVLGPGQHCYRCGDVIDVTHCGSLLVFIQNEAGARHIHFTDEMVSNVVLSMSPGLASMDASGTSSWQRGHQSFGPDVVGAPLPPPTASHPPASISATPAPIVGQDVSSVGGTIIGGYSAGHGRRDGGRRGRGRLFDLVDDGEDECVPAADLSGMLSGLSAGMFGGTNAGMSTQEVDIEAISLMGIGGPSVSSADRHAARTFG